ncbi:MAG TPA: PLP-dependent aminotransferase family protein [Anaerolineales bacterium]|nr:PLP-dependent aminotransferase family protein [Anaerolineales bacterium]
MESSIIRELLKMSSLPGVISFAGGYPSPDIFPVEQFIQASDKVLKTQGTDALQYSITEGYVPLREMICERSARYGIKIKPENVLITNGSQQALDLIGKIFIDPGDKVLVEAPTYLGAIQAWRVYGAEFITVETDEYGMIPESLEEMAKQNPKFMYVLPNFQNPTGCTLPLDRREKIIEIAQKYQIPIIEDDPYGQLRYEGDHLPPLVVLDAQVRGNGSDGYKGNVMYLSTFSKILAPGLRIAWVIAPKDVITKMVQGKQGSDLHTSTYSQMLINEVCKNDFLDRHIPTIRSAYKKRRDLMMDLIDEVLPAGISYIRPEGGLFLWALTPEEINTQDLLPKAIEHEVAYVPGGPFYPNNPANNTMRLNFSNASEEGIRTGMNNLGTVLKNALK